MSYLGNSNSVQNFTPAVDYFNGNGSTTSFTLSRPVASVAQVQAVIENVPQSPGSAFTVNGNVITFTSAPPSGTNNIYVYYTSPVTQTIAPSFSTVGWNQLDSNTQQDLGLMGKNKIINGDMRIDQRNAGASVTLTGSNNYPVDRLVGQNNNSNSAVVTAQQSTVAPTGFKNSVVATVTTGGAVSASDRTFLSQFIEGYNVADLGFGTANAKTVTLSFWVRSSSTGTFGGSLSNSAVNRAYPFTYTISVANTWEYKTVTIAGDTSGTWVTDNGVGLRVYFGLGIGTDRQGTAGAWGSADYRSATGVTNIVTTTGATFYLTGVQLEVGTQATAFSTAGGSYGAELALCQRYYYLVAKGDTTNIATGYYHGSSQLRAAVIFPTLMRGTPTLVSPTGSTYYFMEKNGGSDFFNSFTIYQAQPYSAVIYNASEVSGTDGFAGNLVINGSVGSVAFSAEL